MTVEQLTVRLLSHTPNPLALVAYSARTCKKSINKSDSPPVLALAGKSVELARSADSLLVGPKDRNLISECISEGHESIFEHPSFSFEIDFSRAAQAQMLRHRLASYSAESSRAVGLTSETKASEKFYIPHTIKHSELVLGYNEIHGNEETAQMRFWLCIENCMDTYRDMVEAGIPIEDARYVLPLALMQPVVMTMNLRQWRHVVATRACKHAQHEIRYIAKEIRRVFDTIDDLFMKDAEQFNKCKHKATCGRCLTNWEGMESKTSVREI